MAVYIDELFDTVKTSKWPFTEACHLTADDIEELHDFASRMKLKRKWFQDHPRHPHYDLTAGKRKAAIRLGAIEIDPRARTLLNKALNKIEE